MILLAPLSSGSLATCICMSPCAPVPRIVIGSLSTSLPVRGRMLSRKKIARTDVNAPQMIGPAPRLRKRRPLARFTNQTPNVAPKLIHTVKLNQVLGPIYVI